MYGIQVWCIFQERYDTRYYYKGTENRGRIVWTNNYNNAYVFSERDKAEEFRESNLNNIGIIASKMI